MARKQLDFLLTSFLDSNGDPLTGGKIHIYQAGTTTEEDTYTVISGGSVQTQPITLDTNGIKQLYVGGANNVKVVIKDSTDTTTLYTFDNLEIKPLDGYLPLSGGSGQPMTGDLYGGGNNLRNFATGTFGLNIDGDGTLHVITASAGSVTAHADADEFVAENSGNAGISILANSANSSSLFFGNEADNDIAKIAYNHSTNAFNFTANAVANVMSFRGGSLGINQSDPQKHLHITSGTASLGVLHSGTEFLLDSAGVSGGGETYIQFTTAASNQLQGILFGDSAASSAGYLQYAHATDQMSIATNNVQRVFIVGTGATANIGLNTNSFGASSVGVIGILNATTIPTGNPTGGGVLFCDSGALKYRGSGGTVTTIAAA